MNKKDAGRWAIERIIEVVAEADQCRQAGHHGTGQRLAKLAGHMIFSIYDAFTFDLEDDFLRELEEVRGGVEAAESWTASGVIQQLHRAFNRWPSGISLATEPSSKKPRKPQNRWEP